jgi:thiol:disulfide interchange protein
MNKKAMDWMYIVGIILAALLLVVAIIILTPIGKTMLAKLDILTIG